MPPSNALFGHLLVIGKLLATLAPKCHRHLLPGLLRHKYNLPAVFYVDTWPFSWPVCAIIDPEVEYQVTQQTSLPKHEAIPAYVWPLAGVKNLVCMDGPERKRWREIFNPAFQLLIS